MSNDTTTHQQKLDNLIDIIGLRYWLITRERVEQLGCSDLLPEMEVIKDIETQIDALNARLKAKGYDHLFYINVNYTPPPEPWRDDSLTIQEAIDYLRTLPANTMLSKAFDNSHSFRGDYSCLGIQAVEGRVMAASAFADFLEEDIGSTYSGWKGGEFTMHEDTHVYVAKHGSSYGAIPMSRTFLESLLVVTP